MPKTIRTIVLLIFIIVPQSSCDELRELKNKASNAVSEAKAARVLESFLNALKKGEPGKAYELLSREQKKEVSLMEFSEGYRANTIDVVDYEIKGVRQPDGKTVFSEEITAPVLIPKGTIYLDAVKKDGLTPPGVKRRIQVPLSWILLVEESGTWRIKGKGWGPLHTIAFFGRPKTIVFRPPDTIAAQPMHYEDDNRTYSITLSAKWRDYSRHPTLKSLGSSQKTKLIAFVKRSDKEQLPNLTIQTYDLSKYPAVTTPIDYARMASASGRGRVLRKPFAFKRDGLSGARWEYELGYGPHTRSITDYYLDGRTLILVASASVTEEFERDKKEVLPMLDSFRFSTK